MLGVKFFSFFNFCLRQKSPIGTAPKSLLRVALRHTHSFFHWPLRRFLNKQNYKLFNPIYYTIKSNLNQYLKGFLRFFALNNSRGKCIFWFYTKIKKSSLLSLDLFNFSLFSLTAKQTERINFNFNLLLIQV